ncbi:hypothetical protein BGZ65_003550 [Modicella reniformis]|uniref:HTH APSES-type domain-containing protein n=1 Tax=Modicella reniformis TaxID=1440133 RepID=A0A9P6M994_9FUNG|nr:hypothetical protein BGZ65_003550 [Modicella reniformis]
MARSKSKAAAATVTNSTTTMITTAEESVLTLEASETTSTSEITSAALGQRALPIFGNPLISNAAIADSMILKPKSGRVNTMVATKDSSSSSSSSSSNNAVSVLKITAPKAKGEVVVMRRMDSDLVNASSMFSAAYPSITESMLTKENDYIVSKYEGERAIVEQDESEPLSGVWVTISQARELAKEYGIDQFMQSLLDAPVRKTVVKSSVPSTVPIISLTPPVATSVAEPIIIATGEVATTESIETTTVIRTSIVVEMTTEEKIVEADITTTTTDDIEDTEQEDTDEKNEQGRDEVAGMEETAPRQKKRKIEELEDQSAKDRKRYRGIITIGTVAVGLAAAAVVALPQVLPYFS